MIMKSSGRRYIPPKHLFLQEPHSVNVPEDAILHFHILFTVQVRKLEIMCPYLISYFGGRYCLYSRWKNDTYQQHAKLLRKRGEAQKKIKSIMKRVSKENIKPVGRLIGKLTHCSPGFLFDYVCWNL
jgi:hypothetical protein